MTRRDGFTLIELLVVITIIVVLLALLTPALDKAVYQAELAVCGSRQKAVISAATLYAHDHARRYPDRFQTPGATNEWQATQLISAVGTQDPDGGDLRPVLRGYFALNAMLNDPLAPGKLDFERSSPEAYTHTPYSLWFGWRLKPVLRGMLRLGDAMEWDTIAPNDPGRRVRLNVLVSDLDVHLYDPVGPNDGGGYWGAHPDRARMAWPEFKQNVDMFATEKALFGSPTGMYTYANWRTLNAQPRSAIDRNAGFADGAVHRYVDLEPNAPSMIHAPVRANGAAGSARNHLLAQ